MSVRQDTATVMQRCLALLRRLQRGPATRDELIEAALAVVGREGYGDTRQARDKRFDGDKRRLRDWLGLEWHYDARTGTYEIVDVWAPLLDLSDEALAAVAFLQETFNPSAPMHDEVQNLLGTLASYLPPERRGALERQRAALQVEWGQRDDDVIPPDVQAGLRRAYVERRMVAFDYLSPSHEDGLPRRHVVEPWEPFFDAVRGHYYLRGYCRRSAGPEGRNEQNRYVLYRQGRMSNLELLPHKLPPSPPKAPRVELVYRLAPKIARQGDVTRHTGIEVLALERQPDGSVVVRAETDNVWWAVRTLLHYGPNCQVLGGDEALWEMRRTVRALGRVYGEGGD